MEPKNYNQVKNKSRTWKITIISNILFIIELILGIILLITIKTPDIFKMYLTSVLGPSIPFTLGVNAVYIGGEKMKDSFQAKTGVTDYEKFQQKKAELLSKSKVEQGK